MFSRNTTTTTIAAMLVTVTTATAKASDWKPSSKPASSVTQTAFQEPLSAPAFEPDEDAPTAPLLLPIPDSDPAHQAAGSADKNSEAADSGELDIPNFEPDDSEASAESETPATSDANSSTSASKPATIESEDTTPTTNEDPVGKSSLKLSDAEEEDEEAEDVFDPSKWVGRWNESSMDWVLRNGSDGIGFFSLTGDTPSWEFDLDADEEGLETDFGTGIHFVDGPGRSGSDLPPRLFDIFWNTRFKAETDYGFGIEANFKMGLFTDFEDSVREGWRFPGRVLAYSDFWTVEKTGRIVAGFEYLDLEQTEILPAGGIIFEPNPDTKIDLYFPRPQIRFRVDQEESGDQWLYFRGEYHGSAWAIERTAGNADLVSLTEYRATVGLETIPSDKEESSSFLEVGFLFNRDLEYRSGVGNFQPDDTVVIRLGSRY